MSEPALTPAQEKAKRRQEKLAAKFDARMKFVAGEVKTLEEPESSASALPATPSTEQKSNGENSISDKTPEANSGGKEGELSSEQQIPAVSEPEKPKWEKKWEQSLSAVKTKVELSADTLASLDVTAKMAVEAPRAQQALSSRSTPVTNPTKSRSFNLKLDSILATILVLFLGIMSGTTNGMFIVDNVWLPMGSFLIFAVLIRVILSASLSRLGLISSKSRTEQSAGGGGMIDMAISFLPPAIKELVRNFKMVSGVFKDSYDDMLLFCFAHALASRFATAKVGEQ